MALLVALQGEPVDLGVADAALATRFAIDHRGVGLLTKWGYREHISIPRSAPPLGAEPEVGEGFGQRHLKTRRILARGRRLDQPLGKRCLFSLNDAHHSGWVRDRRDILLSWSRHLLHWRSKLSLSPPLCQHRQICKVEQTRWIGRGAAKGSFDDRGILGLDCGWAAAEVPSPRIRTGQVVKIRESVPQAMHGDPGIRPEHQFRRGWKTTGEYLTRPDGSLVLLGRPSYPEQPDVGG